jgi:cell fate (sporulation/competence/biofilm development) regulator YmcA (YheA/YmcA/DUF963 family)
MTTPHDPSPAASPGVDPLETMLVEMNAVYRTAPSGGSFREMVHRWMDVCAAERQQHTERETMLRTFWINETRHWREQVDACQPYVKDGEPVAVCIARNRADADVLMTLLAREKAEVASLTQHLDRETELRREAERKIAALHTQLDRIPYADEYDQMQHDLSEARKQLTEAKQARVALENKATSRTASEVAIRLIDDPQNP